MTIRYRWFVCCSAKVHNGTRCLDSCLSTHCFASDGHEVPTMLHALCGDQRPSPSSSITYRIYIITHLSALPRQRRTLELIVAGRGFPASASGTNASRLHRGDLLAIRRSCKSKNCFIHTHRSLRGNRKCHECFIHSVSTKPSPVASTHAPSQLYSDSTCYPTPPHRLWLIPARVPTRVAGFRLETGIRSSRYRLERT